MSKDKQTEKENRTIFIIIAIILLIAIGIIITWYFTRDKKEETKKEKPKTQDVVKKEDTEEVISYTENVQSLAVNTNETETETVNATNPEIKYSSILEKVISNYNGVITNGASLEVFKNASAYDYKGDTASLNITILGYKQDGTKVNLTNVSYIPSGIVKVEVIYTATDNDGRESTKTISFKVESGLESLTFENAVLDKDYNKTTYDYELTVDSAATTVTGSYTSEQTVTVTLNDEEVEVNDDKTFTVALADEENTLKFTVDEKVITVVIKREDPASNELETLTINGEEQDVSNTTINYNTENDVLDATSVEIEATAVEGATVEGTGTIELENEGLNEITVTVTNNGLTKTYTINIYRAAVDATITAQDENGNDITLSKEDDKFTTTVSSDVNTITLSADGYQLSETSLNLETGSKEFTITVTSDGGITKDYTVVITKEEEPAVSVASLNTFSTKREIISEEKVNTFEEEKINNEDIILENTEVE